jgi:transposase-like protein
VNVLTQVPKTTQAAVREELAAMPYAPTRAEAERRRDAFATRYRRRYPRAVAILEKDWDRLVTFYDFPEGHWKHLRTTNVIESPFAAVRLRTDAAKRFKKVANATALLWRLLLVAERRFRRLDAPELLAAVYDGRKFENGKLMKEKALKAAA